MPTFYVSQTGTGNGSSSSVPMSPAAFNANTYSIAAGDTVYVLGVVTQQLSGALSGSSGNPITLRGDYSGNAGSIVISDEVTNCLYLNDVNYWDVINLTITGGLRGIYLRETGFAGTTARYINITGCTISGQGGASTNSNAIQGWGQYIVISGCTISDVDCDGIWLQGNNCEISDCDIRDISNGTANGDCIQFSTLYTNVVIARNYLDASNVDVKECIILGGTTTATNILIEDNICLAHPDATLTGSKGINLEYCASGIVRGNDITGGYGGLWLTNCDNLSVHGNICKSATNSGILVDSVSTSNLIVFNVVDNCPYGINTSNLGSTSVTVANNLILNSATYGLYQHAAQAGIHGYNCYFGNATNSNQTLGSGNVTSDPLVLSDSDYRLQSNSPCHRAGVAINSYQTFHGYNGRAFERGNPTIGAYPQLFRDL